MVLLYKLTHLEKVAERWHDCARIVFTVKLGCVQVETHLNCI